MADDLGTRLVQAGLLTREQLARVLGASPRNEGALAVGLVHAGLSPDALAGYFVAAGFGPLMEAVDLANAEPVAAAKIPGAMALELCALPIYDSPAGLVVAMAAPTDRHAVSEIGRAAGSLVLPTAARVTELRAALLLAYPEAEAPAARTIRESEPPVLELVNVRKRGRPAEPAGLEGYRGSTRGAERVEALATVGVAAEDSEAVLPLVRTKPVASEPAPRRRPQAFRKKVITKNFERPKRRQRTDTAPAGRPDPGGAWKKGPSAPSGPSYTATASPAAPSATPPQAPTGPLDTPSATPASPGTPDHTSPGPLDSPPAPAEARPPDTAASPAAAKPLARLNLKQRASSTSIGAVEMTEVVDSSARDQGASRPKSIIPVEHESWDEGLPPNKVKPSKLRRLSERPTRPSRPAPIGGTLAAIRASKGRDQVVELACQGALTVARAAVLLALRKNVLKGWDGAGSSLSRDAVRNLWIPTNSPSMFRDVVSRHVPYLGTPGTTAADGLFRAALGSRGGDVALLPVLVGGKLVGVFAADDMRHAAEGTERIEILARAIGEAFERIIVQKKR